MTKNNNTSELYWCKVDIPANINGCWLWNAALNVDGYGHFHYKNYIVRSNRMAFYYHTGRWPRKGMVVDHLCGVRKCVNPRHLRETTQAKNNAMKIQHGTNTGNNRINTFSKNDMDLIYYYLINNMYNKNQIAKIFGVHHSTINKLIYHTNKWKNYVNLHHNGVYP